MIIFGQAKKGKGGRKLTARCWMAEEFPLSLQQLSPVLDVIGHANKHVARVGFGWSPRVAAYACLMHTPRCCSFQRRGLAALCRCVHMHGPFAKCS